MNKLYYGNNLGALRGSVAMESVDLIHPGLPSNFKHDDNLLFKTPKALAGGSGEATCRAAQSEAEDGRIIRGPNGDGSEMMKAPVKL